jgi:hypothetical protein
VAASAESLIHRLPSCFMTSGATPANSRNMSEADRLDDLTRSPPTRKREELQELPAPR